MPRPRQKAPRRTFGAIRQLPSGRYQARYPSTADDTLRPAPETFETKRDAEAFLVQVQADQMRGDWLDPTARRGLVRRLRHTLDRGTWPRPDHD